MMSQYISMTTGKAVAGKEMKKVEFPLLSFRLGKDEMIEHRGFCDSSNGRKHKSM